MDRLAMYRDLQAVHELISAETPSLQSVADTYAALQRYRYIESLPLTISTEVRLQRAVASKIREL